MNEISKYVNLTNNYVVSYKKIMLKSGLIKNDYTELVFESSEDLNIKDIIEAAQKKNPEIVVLYNVRIYRIYENNKLLSQHRLFINRHKYIYDRDIIKCNNGKIQLRK